MENVVLIVHLLLALTLIGVIAAQKSAGSSVIDRLGGSGTVEQQDEQSLPDIDDLLPPSANDAAPLVPRAD